VSAVRGSAPARRLPDKLEHGGTQTMYLKAAFLPGLMAADVDADSVLRCELWRQVQCSFPGLAGTRLRLDQGGGDHLVLIVDATRAFRFPRPGKHGLDLEIRVLRALGRRVRIAVPSYDLVDPNGRFASYLLIAGVPLTPVRFSALTNDNARSAIAQAVGLLKTLHALDPSAVEPVDTWPRMWSADQFADQLRDARLAALASRAPELLPAIEAFLWRYQTDRAPRDVVLHGDLVSDHLLVDEFTGRLTGIIDFSDVALGDPAHDLLGFWAYGERAATQAVAQYDPSDADPTLLARSRNHFIRYRIDRLVEIIVDGAPADPIREHAAALARLLADPSSTTPA
jgi:aminoglycoside phosphotransferase (APT) family kinase protein